MNAMRIPVGYNGNGEVCIIAFDMIADPELRQQVEELCQAQREEK